MDEWYVQRIGSCVEGSKEFQQAIESERSRRKEQSAVAMGKLDFGISD
jgi:hypothetical protein